MKNYFLKNSKLFLDYSILPLSLFDISVSGIPDSAEKGRSSKRMITTPIILSINIEN